ncbi:hypothetical protein mRhiFer1_008431 [Rhinolophus ferrumequinum]|uniref:Uncharacterized protein n=1 Tax=Rhinolophus ferrumequinum TaxID=59479 RepID=A0A7J7V8E6_RHIFE|nr:hypothetical protein mRhiFer1_008431 [Rhinolophus ferrumequinum]
MWSLVEHSFGKSEPFSQRNGYQMEEFLVKACSGMCWRLWEGLEADERNVLDAGDFTVKQETKAIKGWTSKSLGQALLPWTALWELETGDSSGTLCIHKHHTCQKLDLMGLDFVLGADITWRV